MKIVHFHSIKCIKHFVMFIKHLIYQCLSIDCKYILDYIDKLQKEKLSLKQLKVY